MKTIIITLLSFLSIASAGPLWTHRAEEGEDATSAHFYFYLSNGDSIQRVRWVWNGGAQNAPTVTDYVLGAGKITIRHGQAKREDLVALTSGRDAAVEWTKEYSISTRADEKMLASAPPAKEQTDEQRTDLKNLIDLLAKERKTPGKEFTAPGAAEQTDK